MDHNNIRLIKSTEKYIEKTIFIHPVDEWWYFTGGQNADNSDDQTMDTPDEFHVNLIHLIYCNGAIQGGFAQVEERGHCFDKYWLLFSLRHEGIFDFTENIAIYNATIGNIKPIEMKDNWPIFNNTSFRAHGLCLIGESKDATSKWHL